MPKRGFERPIGAAADLSELEYISALHQTQSGPIRTDGSIRDVDVMHFLRSRYGLEVDIDTVRRTVLFGLGGDFEGVDDGEDEHRTPPSVLFGLGRGFKGGDDGEDEHENEIADDEECDNENGNSDNVAEDSEDNVNGIDLAEMVAILLIPTLIKSARMDHSSIFDEPNETEKKRQRRRSDFFYDEASVAYPDKGLIRDVLAMILGDVTGSAMPKKLSSSLIRSILIALGEEDLANNDGLVEEMVRAAAGRVGGVGGGGRGGAPLLDADAFARGLTSDVLLLDVESEVRMSSNYDDALIAGWDLSSAEDNQDVFHDAYKGPEEATRRRRGQNIDPSLKEKLKPTFSAAGIDFIADQYQSKMLVIFLWTGFVLIYFAFRARIDARIAMSLECDEQNNWGCSISKSVMRWLYILGLLAGLGLTYIGLGSIGNTARARKRKWPLILGIASVAMLGYGPVLFFRHTPEEAPTETELLISVLAFIVSSGAIILQLHLMFGPLLQRCFSSPRCRCSMDSALAERIIAPGSVRAEAKIKQAAAHKINTMVKNAREVHSGSKASGDKFSFGQGLVNFSLQENKVENAGGFLWTWKRIFSGELYTMEGIWISSRIWSGNFAQILMSIFILAFGAIITQHVVKQWREGLESDDRLFVILGWFGVEINRTEIATLATSNMDQNVQLFMSPKFEQMGCGRTMADVIDDFAASNNTFVNTSSNEVCALLEHAVKSGIFGASVLINRTTDSVVNAVSQVVDEISDPLYPKDEVMVMAPLVLATVVAFLSVVILSVVYIPAVISTTLKLRSGLIPFMHDEKNQRRYRSQMDLVTLVLGSMFWGALYSAAFIGASSGVILFLFLWQATQRYVVWISATLIGLIITISLKMFITYVFLRATVYVAFYQRKPAQGNIVSLILEVANIAYCIWTALARAGMLIFISALYIGRLDKPLLADGVGVSELGLSDNYPTIFRSDILAHEAHRHPYLERLGLIYMMKIRYGENFGNKAGYCFRLIFAVALMPWIRKYRVMARPNLLDEEDRGKKMSIQRFDNSFLLPKSSRLRSSVITTLGLMGKTAMLTVGQLETEPDAEEMQAENLGLRAENQGLRTENHILQTENQGLRAENQGLREALAAANNNVVFVSNIEGV